MNTKVEFYSLLYFSDGEEIPNLSKFLKSKKEIILIRNAFSLSAQIHKLGYKHTLITNNKKKILQTIDYNFPIKKINFKKILDKKTKFYSAHFKVDVYKYLSKQEGISCLLDIDILILRNFSKYFINKLNNYNLLFSQDRETQNSDEINYILQKLINLKLTKPDWYGGEFISGDSYFYKNIYHVIKKIYPNYKKNINSFFHQGDETLLNTAIHYLKANNNITFMDINKKKIIQRHWSVMADDRKKLIPHLDNILLHIPSDKYFLSKLYAHKYSFDDIRKKYIKYHNSAFRNLFVRLKNFKIFILNFFDFFKADKKI